MLSSMRLLAILALVLATSVAACGGGEDESGAPAGWNGPQRPYPADGVLPVEEFRAYAESVDAEWERAPGALALAFLRLPAGGGGPESPTVTVSPLAGQEVTVTRTGLADDSVAAERYVLTVEEDGDRWALAAAQWEQRCHPMRGHQEFSPELCV